MKFDIRKLVSDLGGASRVAQKLGITRTIPYQWMDRDYISSTYLAKIKEAHPALDLDKYITEGERRVREKRSSA
jgi:hypothetical protein